jgi:hypothetical protein
VPDNLTVTIGADTSKARGELKLLQAELTNLGKQINAAVNAGDTARAKGLSETFGVMKDRAVVLDRSLKDLGRTGSRAFNEVGRAATEADERINITARSMGKIFKQLQSLRGGGSLIGSFVGGGVGGAAGFSVSNVITTLIDKFDELAKTMREIRDLARETGQKPLMVQGFQELAKESGKSAEAANKFLSGVSATIAKVATETPDATKSMTQNFATFGNTTVQVMRGGETAVRDFSDALAILQVDKEKLRKLPADKQIEALGAAFQRAEKNAKQLRLSEIQLNEISKSVFGVPAADADEFINLLSKRDAKIKELAASQRGATKPTLDTIDQTAGAWEKLSQQVQESWAAITKNTAEGQASVARGMADFLKNLPQTLMTVLRTGGTVKVFDPIKEEANTLPSFFDNLLSQIGGIFKSKEKEFYFPLEPIKEDANKLVPFFKELTATVGSIWKGFWQGASKEADTAMAKIGAAIGSKVAASAMPSVKYGPGTGDTGGYGPSSLGGAGYGPGSFPTQSILPGTADYQAPPPKMVSFAGIERGAQYTRSAAESAADAAAASQSAAEASAMAVNSWVDPSYRYAEGGMVHGPGTPTSDSVTARLSAGEFVMRAAAVQRWGPQFMQALNGIGGRMPSRGIPSFAGGGMVTAGGHGGAVVNLVFNGNSFALRADNAIVGGLTREARRAGMLSAGKPAGVFQ